jgi:hypothetical protein
LKKNKIIFHKDHTPAHKSVLAIGKLQDLRYDLLTISYSPDLAPTDFHLFPNLKKFVSGKHFASNEQVVERAIDQYFNSLPDFHFQEGILILKNGWTKRVEVKGDYVGK